MKIVYVVDVHDRVERVDEVLRAVPDADVLVVGGDITTAGTSDDAERAIERWRPLATHLLAVAGNMDSPAIDDRLVDCGVSIDGRGVVLDDVGFAGVSAAPHSPLHTPYEIPDEELGRRAAAGLAEVAAARVRIFCPHTPPHGTACDRIRSGEHVGSRSLRALVEQTQPDVVLCGHIHESRGVDSLGLTQIVNPGPVASGHFALVEVNDTVSVTLEG